ncbi:hypothetical protein HZA41_00265, partial [Candidatus Peregrinibacteria bacterium]|nr:hypothetical protein [Candidatus Peregrinibacteria bacterium]
SNTNSSTDSGQNSNTDTSTKTNTDSTKKSDIVKTKKTILGENGSYTKKTSPKTAPETPAPAPLETSSGGSQTSETPQTTPTEKTAEINTTTATPTETTSAENSTGTSAGGGSSLTETKTKTESKKTENEPTAFETIIASIIDNIETKTENTSPTDCSAENGEEDRDSDGLSDMMECYLGTDKTKKDTDGDGITDGEEVLSYNTNAVDSKSIPNLETPIKPSITNLFKGTLIADNTPLISGTAKPFSMLTFILINTNGDRYIAGKKQTEKEGKFLFEFPALLDGEYSILIEEQDAETKKIIAVSDPMPMSIQTDIAFSAPIIESLSGEKIGTNTENRLITSDRRPKIIIKNPMPGNIIMAQWQSAIFASAILADSLDQSVAIAPPKELELGDHTVWIYSINPKDNRRSEDTKLEFTIRDAIAKTAISIFSKQNLILLIALFILATGTLFFLSKKHHAHRHQNGKKHHNRQSPRTDKEKTRQT